VPAGEYHAMVDRLDDLELNALAEARRDGPFVEVGLAEL
jgi:antitoxin StbD